MSNPEKRKYRPARDYHRIFRLGSFDSVDTTRDTAYPSSRALSRSYLSLFSSLFYFFLFFFFYCSPSSPGGFIFYPVRSCAKRQTRRNLLENGRNVWSTTTSFMASVNFSLYIHKCTYIYIYMIYCICISLSLVLFHRARSRKKNISYIYIQYILCTTDWHALAVFL